MLLFGCGLWSEVISIAGLASSGSLPAFGIPPPLDVNLLGMQMPIRLVVQSHHLLFGSLPDVDRSAARGDV